MSEDMPTIYYGCEVCLRYVDMQLVEEFSCIFGAAGAQSEGTRQKRGGAGIHAKAIVELLLLHRSAQAGSRVVPVQGAVDLEPRAEPVVSELYLEI